MKLIDRIGIDISRRLKLEDAITWAAQHGLKHIDIQLDTGDNALTKFDTKRCANVRKLLDSLMPEAVADYGPLPPREGCGLRIRLHSAKQPEHDKKPRGPGPLKVARDLLKDAKKIEPPRG